MQAYPYLPPCSSIIDLTVVNNNRFRRNRTRAGASSGERLRRTSPGRAAPIAQAHRPLTALSELPEVREDSLSSPPSFSMECAGFQISSYKKGSGFTAE